MLTNHELDQLLKVRVMVARFGEMDLAGWWNTRGQLGALGTATVRRGMPRTHYFAQARSVFAVAAHRCQEYYDAPRAVTLWSLPGSTGQAFDARWERWLDEAEAWDPFFRSVEQLPPGDLAASLREADLATGDQLQAVAALGTRAQGRAVELPGVFDGSIGAIALLALGFSRGDRGALAVPYMAAGSAE